MSRRQVLQAIAECEAEGRFDVHVDPIPEELIVPVTQDFEYPCYRRGLRRMLNYIEKAFIVWPFIWFQNKFVLRTRVEGRENLKGLRAAVITCNHVAKFDCLAVKYAAFGHRTYTVAAPFNNMKGFFGDMMRAGDMMPMSESFHAQCNFYRAVKDVLVQKKQFLVMYPEAAMWWHYKKPRPFKPGAFHMAAKYGAPVVPTFITFRDSGKKDAEGLPKYYFTLHITPPIYPKSELSLKENKDYLCREAFEACRRVYESSYGVKLEYECYRRRDDDNA